MVRFVTAGESHGMALVGIIEGIPADLDLTANDIDRHLARRQLGYGRSGRMAIEQDRATILSGIRFGKTIGSPIAVQITNRDWENWKDVMPIEPPAGGAPIRKVTLPRPGHADLAGAVKYGFDDLRPVIERASARETAMRVALGSVARRCLAEFGITIASHVIQIGGEALTDRERGDIRRRPLAELDALADASDVRCVSPDASGRMVAAVKEARQNGDSVGGIFEVLADGLPVGLGSYTHWDRRLDGLLAQYVASIHAIKGVEIGDAFVNAGMMGSQVHDEIFYAPARGFYRETNRSGGVEGGMSTGERLVVRAAMKPIPTLARPLRSADLTTKEPASAHKERTDTCAVPAASVVAEAMVALALINPFLEKFGGDSVPEIRRHMKP